MKKWESHFSFTKQERSGIFFLLVLVVLLQLGYWWLSTRDGRSDPLLKVDKAGQVWVDSVKAAQKMDSAHVYLTNPNYMSDYRAYALGISSSALTRIRNYRSTGKFFYSHADFQKVVQLPDSLWQKVEPLLKFQKKYKKTRIVSGTTRNEKVFVKKDINTATAQELMMVTGVGKVLSERIIKFRTSLGGFFDDDHVRETFGLDSVVADRLLQRFVVVSMPEVAVIRLNEATVMELAQTPYIRYRIAQAIVAYRDSVGVIGNWSEIMAVPGFPQERINRIQLYLSLD